VAAPGDTFKGNVKVVDFGLFGGSTCASPTAGASASTTESIAVASFIENLLFPLGTDHLELLVDFEAVHYVVTDKQPHPRVT
jgi:hypothetical protein